MIRKIILIFLWLMTPPVWALDITDDLGQIFYLQKPAARIVALTPHAVELVYSAGAQQALVGVVDYSDYPEEAKKIPNVGGYAGFNIEAIFALKPDVILYWPEGNPVREIERLRKLKLPLFAINTNSFDDIARNLIQIGELTGRQAQSKKTAQDFLQKVAQLKKANAHKKTVRVFYQVWHEPILTQNKNSFISKLLELCGGENIFADLPMTSPQISVEAVLAANPEVILGSGVGGTRPQWLDDWQRYPSLQAVKKQQIFHTHSDWMHRPTVRLLLGAQEVCGLLDKVRAHE